MKFINKLLCRIFGHKIKFIAVTNGYLIYQCPRCEHFKFEKIDLRKSLMEIK